MSRVMHSGVTDSGSNGSSHNMRSTKVRNSAPPLPFFLTTSFLRALAPSATSRQAKRGFKIARLPCKCLVYAQLGRKTKNGSCFPLPKRTRSRGDQRKKGMRNQIVKAWQNPQGSWV